MDEWKREGACHGIHVEVSKQFFDYRYFDQVKKTYCDNCSVRQECLDFSLEPKEIVLTEQGRGMLYRGEDYGIWGGLTPDERDQYARSINWRGNK